MKGRALPWLTTVGAAAIALAATTESETIAEPEAPNAMCKEKEPENKTFSIALRVRRVTYEDAYVAVPVTDKIMKKKEDGTHDIDFEAFVKEAVRISKDKRVEWKVESSTTEAHPIQQPLPEGRKSLDAFYDLPAKP